MIDPLAEKYYSISPYAYVANNPINAIDPDGEKIVFVNGYLGFGTSQGGSSYWGGASSSFVKGAQAFFKDNATPFFSNYDFSLFSANTRREAGYSYAKENYDQLVSGMTKGEDVFRIVTHSMGGVFSDGMIAYLKEQGWNVEVAVHFNAWEPSKIQKWNFTLLFDATVTNDWVQSLGINNGNRDIPGANYTHREESDAGYKYRHRHLIDSGDIWNAFGNYAWYRSMVLTIQSWLQQNPDIKIYEE